MSERKSRLIRKAARMAYIHYDYHWNKAKPEWWRIRKRRAWKRGRPSYKDLEWQFKRYARRR